MVSAVRYSFGRENLSINLVKYRLRSALPRIRKINHILLKPNTRIEGSYTNGQMGKCKKKRLEMQNNELSKSRRALRKLHRKELKTKRDAFYRKNLPGILRNKLIKCSEDKTVHRNLVDAVNKEKEMKITDQNMKKLQQANEIEGRIIKKLETNLRLRKLKGKSIPKMFVTDGLDYVLEACNVMDCDQYLHLERKTADTGDSFEERIMKEQKRQVKNSEGKISRTDETIPLITDSNREAVQDAVVENTEMKPCSFEVQEVAFETEHVQKLDKQLKGLLNRLTQNNMKSIVDKFEELCMSHSHNLINRVFVGLLMESLVRPISTPEELVKVHAVFITALHANVGDAIGAFVLEALANKFHHFLEHQQVENKQLDNTVILICHLHSVKLMDATVMYDILRKLAERFTEKEVELIILMLKIVGVSLRREDPEAFKAFTLMIQKKAQDYGAVNINKRMKFLCEIVVSLKNGNFMKIAGYNPSQAETLRKLLRGLARQSVCQLRVSLKDLLARDKLGRWWEPSATVAPSCGAPCSDKLVQLARSQGMNTQLRVNTFCVLMTSDDYLDAYRKIISAGVKSGQEREIMYVVMHCCLQEKAFNKYYVYVAKQLCEFDRKFRMAMYFTVWDKLKQLQRMSHFQRHNLARFVSCLVLHKKLTLSVLKVLDFVTLSKIQVSFLHELFSEVLLVESEEMLREIFQNITLSAKLRTFCKGLHIFLSHFFKTDTEAEKNSLCHRVKMAADILAVADSKMRFQM